MANESADNWIKEIYNDTMSKVIARFILFTIFVVLVATSIAHFVRMFNGTHSKLLWGLDEVNIPKDHPDVDTIWSTLPVKHDTFTIYKDKIIYVNSNKTPNLDSKNPNVPTISIKSVDQKGGHTGIDFGNP